MSAVQVINLAYEKKVTIRVTTDSWRSFTDYEACYTPAEAGSPMPFGSYLRPTNGPAPFTS
ncbi:unnamed protein product, partial [Protopolystoma xenopodis]